MDGCTGLWLALVIDSLALFIHMLISDVIDCVGSA